MKKSFPFEFEAYIAGTAFLSRREKGAYVDLLCIQAGKGRLTIEMIKDILNGDFEVWEKIKGKFIEENGLIYNKKLERSMQGKCKKSDETIQIDRLKIETRINESKLKFYNDCKPFLNRYPKEMLRAFYNYWTELNKSGVKMRFELQQTFEISKRLATWAGKDKTFTPGLALDNITFKELVYRFNKGETDIWEKYEAITPGDKRTLWKIKSKT
jgi:hypothetical protein